MTDSQRQLYDYLLLPVMVSRHYREIMYENGRLLSPQKYRNGLDGDMSDVSVCFYEKLYGHVIPGLKILSDDGSFVNPEFAGDTMYSFSTVANLVLGDKNKNCRSPYETWPEELKEFYSVSHTLANFWMIPARFGRMGTKLNRYDSPDLFLDKLKARFSEFQEEYEILYKGRAYQSYFTMFSDYEMFCRAHFAVRSDRISESSYWSQDACREALPFLTEAVRDRARRIAVSGIFDVSDIPS